MPRLSILYTANLQGNFSRLPLLFSLIQQTRRRCWEAGTAGVLLVDLGNAFDPDAWLCQTTENRAIYIILDAMGYNTVYADGLDPQNLRALQSIVQVKLLQPPAFYLWRWRDLEICIGPDCTSPSVWWDSLPFVGDFPAMNRDGHLILYPPPLPLARVDVEYPAMQILYTELLALDPQLFPDPTIIAALDFVTREARAYQHKKGVAE